jgi:hypothetical protein
MKLMLMTQRHYTPVAQIARYWQIVGAPSARAVPTLTRVQTRLARGLTVPAAFSTPPIGIGVVLLVALALRAPLLAGGQIDYDEGVYWQSLRSLAAGHQLFASVYSSQPPLSCSP